MNDVTWFIFMSHLVWRKLHENNLQPLKWTLNRFLSGFRVRFLLNSMWHGQFTMIIESICPVFYRSIPRYHVVHPSYLGFSLKGAFFESFFYLFDCVATNACEYWPDMITVWINLGHIRWTNDFYLSWIIDQNWPFSQSRFLVRWDFRLVWTSMTMTLDWPNYLLTHLLTGHVTCPTHPPNDETYCCCYTVLDNS